MTKEMVVSATNQDTKIAILEDGQVVEVYFEREKEYSLAGSIYKGRVTRILPGMQSAFVNIGLERDAFLYVSDFLEGVEEYERVATTPAERGGSRERPPKVIAVSPPPEPPAESAPVPSIAPPAPPRAEPEASQPRTEAAPSGEGEEGRGGKSRRFSRRSRRHRGGPRGLPESKYARQGAPPPQAPPREPREDRPPREVREPREPREDRVPLTPRAPRAVEGQQPERIILPGESLAKYKEVAVSVSESETVPPPALEAAAGMLTGQISETVVPPDILTVPQDIQDIEESIVEDRDLTPYFAEPVVVASARSEAETTVPQGYLSVEEAVEAAREEKMNEELEEEAVELAEPDAPEPGPSAAAPEGSDSWSFWEEPLPGSAAAEAEAAAAYFEGEMEPPAMAPEEDADVITAEGAGAEAGPAPQGAAVRERPGHPRFQRRPRFGQRRPQRGEEQRRRGRTWERERETPKPLIGDMLKEGQEILVQIAKEPLGKKGARITSHIALPGRYVVFMPTLDHVGVSRKIASDEERHRLKRIIVEQTRGRSGGFIVRTAGEGHSEEDLRQDVLFLVNLWAEVKTKAEKANAPTLLHHDLDLTLRTLRDQISDEFQTIWVDNEQAYEQIVSLVQKFQPALANRVRLFTKDVPLFEETGVQEEINKALKPKVWLKSGGYIVINQTEALVAIDVNTGKFVGKSNRLEDTIVKTNVEAIQEIVRQIRLRDLGGIIVIDFIDMDERRNRQRVMSELEDALRADKSPSKILAFNEFGLIAITRKRVRQSLERTLCQPCSYCSGAGLVKTPATVCLEILSEAKKMASELGGKHITLRVNPEVGKALKSRDNAVLAALEEITGRGVIIRSDAAVHIENFYFD